jgi:hypothetical protein
VGDRFDHGELSALLYASEAPELALHARWRCPGGPPPGDRLGSR